LIEETKMSIRTLKIASLVLILLLLTTLRAPAHSGEPRLEISPERLAPAAVLDVRGVNYEPEEEIQLTLVGPQVELPLGLVTADPDGIFIQVILLPENLLEGIYMLRANSDDHVNFSPQFTVSGTAPSNPEEYQDGQRDEEDGLLVPMPTFQPGATAASAPTPIQAESTPAVTSDLVSRTTTPNEPVSSRTQTLVLAIVFLILISVVVLGRMAMGNR
jgi:hypothetical protein